MISSDKRQDLIASRRSPDLSVAATIFLRPDRS